MATSNARSTDATHVPRPRPGERDAPVTIPLDAEAALWALLHVRPNSARAWPTGQDPCPPPEGQSSGTTD